MDLICLWRDHRAIMVKRDPHKVISRLKPEIPHPNFVKQWREYRNMTQERLAGLIGMAPASISQIESGKQGWSGATLYALAYALRCHPGELLMRNPLDTEAPWSLWERLKAEDRPKAIAILRTLVGDEQEAA